MSAFKQILKRAMPKRKNKREPSPKAMDKEFPPDYPPPRAQSFDLAPGYPPDKPGYPALPEKPSLPPLVFHTSRWSPGTTPADSEADDPPNLSRLTSAEITYPDIDPNNLPRRSRAASVDTITPKPSIVRRSSQQPPAFPVPDTSASRAFENKFENKVIREPTPFGTYHPTSKPAKGNPPSPKRRPSPLPAPQPSHARALSEDTPLRSGFQPITPAPNIADIPRIPTPTEAKTNADSHTHRRAYSPGAESTSTAPGLRFNGGETAPKAKSPAPAQGKPTAHQPRESVHADRPLPPIPRPAPSPSPAIEIVTPGVKSSRTPQGNPPVLPGEPMPSPYLLPRPDSFLPVGSTAGAIMYMNLPQHGEETHGFPYAESPVMVAVPTPSETSLASLDSPQRNVPPRMPSLSAVRPSVPTRTPPSPPPAAPLARSTTPPLKPPQEHVRRHEYGSAPTRAASMNQMNYGASREKTREKSRAVEKHKPVREDDEVDVGDRWSEIAFQLNTALDAAFTLQHLLMKIQDTEAVQLCYGIQRMIKDILPACQPAENRNTEDRMYAPLADVLLGTLDRFSQFCTAFVDRAAGKRKVELHRRDVERLRYFSDILRNLQTPLSKDQIRRQHYEAKSRYTSLVAQHREAEERRRLDNEHDYEQSQLAREVIESYKRKREERRAKADEEKLQRAALREEVERLKSAVRNADSREARTPMEVYVFRSPR